MLLNGNTCLEIRFCVEKIFIYMLLMLSYIGDFGTGVSKKIAFLNSQNAKGGLIITNPVLKMN
jgi:hypothetical protein